MIEKWVVRIVVAACAVLYGMFWYNCFAGAAESVPPDPPAAVEPVKSPEPPAFIPVVLDQKNFDNIKAYLGEIPAKYATPLINTLDQAEFAARETWRFEHAPKTK